MPTTTYFGEDVGLGNCTRLTVHPLADAAHDLFVADLDVIWGTENFDALAVFTGAPFVVNFGGFTDATLIGDGFVNGPPYAGQCAPGFDTNGVGRFATSLPNYYDSRNVFELTFTNAIGALGFYGIDVGDFAGQMTLTLTFEDATTEVLTVPAALSQPSGGVCYFGFILEEGHSGVVSVLFDSNVGGLDLFGFDDVTVGPVPDPPDPPDPPAPVESRASGRHPPELYSRMEWRTITRNGITSRVLVPVGIPRDVGGRSRL